MDPLSITVALSSTILSVAAKFIGDWVVRRRGKSESGITIETSDGRKIVVRNPATLSAEERNAILKQILPDNASEKAESSSS